MSDNNSKGGEMVIVGFKIALGVFLFFLFLRLVAVILMWIGAPFNSGYPYLHPWDQSFIPPLAGSVDAPETSNPDADNVPPGFRVTHN